MEIQETWKDGKLIQRTAKLNPVALSGKVHSKLAKLIIGEPAFNNIKGVSYDDDDIYYTEYYRGTDNPNIAKIFLMNANEQQKIISYAMTEYAIFEAFEKIREILKK